jgi:ribonucleoside-triphosphate reductase
MMDGFMSGGAILHINIAERVTDKEFLKNLLIKSISMGVIYQAINYNLQRCVEGHMSVGKTEKCPVCGKEITDNFSRVVGFLINTKNWHRVRREIDYPHRQWYGKEKK